MSRADDFEGREPPLRARQKLVMLVDDEEDILRACSFGLRIVGVRLSTFSDPPMALRSFRTNPYDLVISDIRMPNMNGFELVREMKKVRSDVLVWFIKRIRNHSLGHREGFPRFEGTEADQKAMHSFESKKCNPTGLALKQKIRVPLDQA